MGIRLQGGFTSVRENAAYVFNIYDSSYSSTVIDFDLDADGFTESYDSEDKGRNKAILTSSMEIEMLVQNSNHTDFITDATNAAEGRFLLEVTKNGNKYWYGYVLPDQFTLQDLPNTTKRVLRIKATDGIGRLKEIDYNNSGTAYSGNETFLDHLYNVIGKIGFGSFYGATEDYVVTYVDWWDQNHTYANTSDPYNLSRFDHRALIVIDSSGEKVYLNTYEVLEQIVKAWNCRFFFSEGTYKLVQINAYQTNAATKVLKVYDKNKGVTTTSTADFDIWNKTTGDLSKYTVGTYDAYHNNGNFKYYPALRETEVQYEHFSTESLIQGEEWTQDSSQTATYNDVDFNSGAARMVFSATLETRSDWVDPTLLETLTYRIRILIKVGTYYLQRTFSFVNGKPVYGAPFWSTTLGYYEFFSRYTYADNITRTEPIDIPPTPLLNEGGQLDLQITFFGAYNNKGEPISSGVSTYTNYYTITDVYIGILVEGNLEDQTDVKVYNATNDDGSTNSKKEVVELLVGDGPSGNTFGAIEVYNGSTWEASTGWRVGNSGTYIEFGQLLANEILAGQKYAVTRYLGTVTGDFVAHGRLRRVEPSVITNYVFIGGRHNLHQDIWEGEWFVIDVDQTGITQQTPRNFSILDLFDQFRRAGTKGPRYRGGDQEDEVPVITIDPSDNGPTQVPIDGDIPSGSEITSITIDGIYSDGILNKGDVVVILTPTGQEVPVIIDGDVSAGDTTVDIVPITPGIDIPEGSVIQVDPVDLYAFVQRARRQTLDFWADLTAQSITDGNPIFYFRVDEQSREYLHRLVSVECQVHTPGGSGAETFDYQLKIDGSNIISTNVAETTTISRTTLDEYLFSGLYTLHISNITATGPVGVNFRLTHVEPLQKPTFIDPASTINGEYPADADAFADGVGVNELYNMSAGNYHGMPHGLVILNYVIIGYRSDADAAPISNDQWYAVSTSNAYGMKKGSVRIKNYTGTTYDDDTAAGVGGVAIGDYYVLGAANPYGVPKWFIKLRKA